MWRSSRAAEIVILCCAAACSTKETVGSKYAKTQLVEALQGGTVTVTNSDDPALAGTVVKIPPGALAADTTITVAEASELRLPADGTAMGPAIDFGPNTVAFSHPITVIIPCPFLAGHDPSGLAIQGLDTDGTTTIRVSNGDLTVDATAKTVAFTASRFFRVGCIWGPPSGGVCPQGQTLCGCCGNGVCLADGTPCPVKCSSVCVSDGGTATVDAGQPGKSCCPAGEEFCGCGNLGKCIPAGQVCPLMCPTTPPPSAGPICCAPGTYLCGCGGHGVCIPTNTACPLTCPVCDPATIPTPCGCLPPGAACGCDPSQPSTVPCQCKPTPGGPSVPINGPICVVDAGSPCADPTEHLTPCGCLPPGGICKSPDAGSTCPSPTERPCCNGTCVPAGAVCPAICLSDGGTQWVDAGVCPPGTAHCPNGTCRPSGGVCP
jgi:hypothetical protein